MRVDEIRPGHLYRIKHPPPRVVRESAVGPVVYVPDARHNGTVSRAGGTPQAAGLSLHGRWMYWAADGPAEFVEPVLIYNFKEELDDAPAQAFLAGWHRAVRSALLMDRLAEAQVASVLEASGALRINLTELDGEACRRAGRVLADWQWPQPADES